MFAQVLIYRKENKRAVPAIQPLCHVLVALVQKNVLRRKEEALHFFADQL